ncbi:MAG: hypothetical protein WA030_02245 [Candidatus Microsaccharimonas sp.]
MALFVRQDENRTELQTRIAAELQEKARKKAEEAELPDGVTDSEYIKNTKQTSKLAWVWLVVFVIVAGLIIWLIVSSL